MDMHSLVGTNINKNDVLINNNNNSDMSVAPPLCSVTVA